MYPQLCTVRVSYDLTERGGVKLKDNSETTFANRPYNNHARCNMIIIVRMRLAVTFCQVLFGV